MAQPCFACGDVTKTAPAYPCCGPCFYRAKIGRFCAACRTKCLIQWRGLCSDCQSKWGAGVLRYAPPKRPRKEVPCKVTTAGDDDDSPSVIELGPGAIALGPGTENSKSSTSETRAAAAKL